MTRTTKHKPIDVPLTRTQIKMLLDAAKARLAVEHLIPAGPERRSLEAAKAALADVYFCRREDTTP